MRAEVEVRVGKFENGNAASMGEDTGGMIKKKKKKKICKKKKLCNFP